MLGLEEIKKIYDKNLSIYEQLKEESLFIIKSKLDQSKIKIHSIQTRVKEFTSLVKKAEVLEIKQQKNVFTEIKDIVGLRIICLFISDIEEISAIINESLDVVYQDNKIDGSSVSSFGYFSVHFICKIKKEYQGPRYDQIKDKNFEIQVRTISMDAWANISHYLDYKSEGEIPKELKRDFFALSGLFYVADTHFEMFFKSKKQKAKIAREDVANNIDVEINFETLEAYINSKFKHREAVDPETISILTQELLGFGFKTIAELDQELIKLYKKKSESRMSKDFNRVGIIRATLRDLNPDYEAYYQKRKQIK